MQAWEYTVATFDIQTETAGQRDEHADRDGMIAELGAHGWELVTVVPLVLSTETSSATTTHERWIFKRLVNPNGLHHAAVESSKSQEQADKPPLSVMKEIPSPHEGNDPT
jgi:hypothetical protein